MRLPKPVDGPGSDKRTPPQPTSTLRWVPVAFPPELLAGALAPVSSGPAQSERIPVEGSDPEPSATLRWLRRTVQFRKDHFPEIDNRKNTADLRRLTVSVTGWLRPDVPTHPPNLRERRVAQHFLAPALPLCSGQLRRLANRSHERDVYSPTQGIPLRNWDPKQWPALHLSVHGEILVQDP